MLQHRNGHILAHPTGRRGEGNLWEILVLEVCYIASFNTLLFIFLHTYSDVCARPFEMKYHHGNDNTIRSHPWWGIPNHNQNEDVNIENDVNSHMIASSGGQWGIV